MTFLMFHQHTTNKGLHNIILFDVVFVLFASAMNEWRKYYSGRLSWLLLYFRM